MKRASGFSEKDEERQRTLGASSAGGSPTDVSAGRSATGGGAGRGVLRTLIPGLPPDALRQPEIVDKLHTEAVSYGLVPAGEAWRIAFWALCRRLDQWRRDKLPTYRRHNRDPPSAVGMLHCLLRKGLPAEELFREVNDDDRRWAIEHIRDLRNQGRQE